MWRCDCDMSDRIRRFASNFASKHPGAAPAIETFRERPGKLTKGVLFHLDNTPATPAVVAVAGAYITVALNWLITLHILLIWYHLTIFCSPTWKTLGWEAVSDRWCHICSLGLFSGVRMRAFDAGIQALHATPMEEVCEQQGRLWHFVEK